MTDRPVTDRPAAVPAPGAAAGADAAAAWLATLDGVVRGIAHGLSNRVGTLGALAEALAAADPSAPFPPILAEEVHRLEETLRVMRLLPRDEGRGAEPLRPADAVKDAVALLEQHPNGRDAEVEVTGGDDAPPVRAHAPSLVHALALLLVSAAGEEGAPLSVTITGEEERAAIRVTGGRADAAAVAGAIAAATALVAGDGGSAERAADGALVVALPTLAAARRRERGG